jgi:hypothetical protein
MASFSRIWLVFATMAVAAMLLFSRGESGVAWAQSAPTSCSTSTSTSTSTSSSTSTSTSTSNSTSTSTSSPTLNNLSAAALDTPGNRPPPAAYVPPCPTGSDSSAGSINEVAKQRFNQMITNRVLGTVLLGINEQINCSDCVSAFGSAGSFSAGVHGRKNITDNLALLAGLAYTHYSEGGYSVTSAPIGAVALRYDFTDWGSSRPFFDIGTILTPYEKVRYRRSYQTSLGAVTVDGNTTAENYAVYGRAGWISRISPRDEVAAAVEVWQLWQRVKGYTDQSVAFNPFDATFNTGTDKTTLAKIGGQWTHMITNSVEGNINGGYVYAFGNQSGIVAAVTGQGMVTPTIGNQGWFEYGGRLGFRISKGWVADVFVNGTLGPQPVGNTIHGGVGLRINY